MLVDLLRGRVDPLESVDDVERFGACCYSVGMGTHRGTVMAADDWGASGRVMEVRPSYHASLPGRFDEWLFIDRTEALSPLFAGAVPDGGSAADTYPFGV